MNVQTDHMTTDHMTLHLAHESIVTVVCPRPTVTLLLFFHCCT